MNRWYARRREIVLGLFAVLAVDALIYFGWVRQPVAQPQASPAQLATLSQEVAGRAADVVHLERVEAQAPRLRSQLEQFAAERLLAERTGFSRMAAELDAAARQAGVRLGRVSYRTTEEKTQPDLVRVEMSTTVEGGYAGLLGYLEELERSPHLYLISQLNLAGAEGGQVRLEMRLATYLRRGAA